MSAIVTVRHEWGDGQVSSARVEVSTSYPDALDQAKLTAVRALIDVVAEMGDED